MPIKTQHDEQPTLNLAPMIDVVFLLIIFFMVATKFSELERNIDVEVPQVKGAGTGQSPPRPHTVTVLANGTVELDGSAISLDQLTQQLTSMCTEEPDLQVVIRGDAACEFQHIATVMGICRESGIAELGITVRIAAAPGKASRH